MGVNKRYIDKDPDYPVWAAWEIYRKSVTFEPVRDNALYTQNFDGARWAAFYAGFYAGREHWRQCHEERRR